MIYRFLEGAVMAAHLAFVLFVAAGGLLALRWRRAALFHLPAAAWGILVEAAGWVCPLTLLESRLRALGGGESLRGDFVERFLMPILYPESLGRRLQILLAAGALGLNVVVYGCVLARRRAAADPSGAPPGPGGPV